MTMTHPTSAAGTTPQEGAGPDTRAHGKYDRATSDWTWPYEGAAPA